MAQPTAVKCVHRFGSEGDEYRGELCGYKEDDLIHNPRAHSAAYHPFVAPDVAQPAAGVELKPDAKSVWEEVRASLDREGKWTAGESGVFYAFFLTGWNHRGIVDHLNTRTPADVQERARRAVGQLDDTVLRGSVEITVFRGNNILAVNSRNFDGFCGIGGKVEPGETFEQAACRELMEETGCEALSIRFIAGHTLDPIKGDDATIKWYCAGFIVDIGDQEPHQNEEGTTPFWTTKENMIQNSLFPEWYTWWFGLLDQLNLTDASGTSQDFQSRDQGTHNEQEIQ